MENGNVKWFDTGKGFGFIQPDHGGRDVYVNINAVRDAGLSGLEEGQVVFYELVCAGGRSAAQDLVLL